MRARIAAIELGPMATDRGLARHHMLIEDAHAHGARVEGGEEVAPGVTLRPPWSPAQVRAAD